LTAPFTHGGVPACPRPGFAGKYAAVSGVTIAGPQFRHPAWPVHANRDYTVQNSACEDSQPQQAVGPPAP
jgi:hypothetical protein